MRVDDGVRPRHHLAQRGEPKERRFVARRVVRGGHLRRAKPGVRLEPDGQVPHQSRGGRRGQVGQRLRRVLGAQGPRAQGVEQGRAGHAVEGFDGGGGDARAVKRHLGCGRGGERVPVLGGGRRFGGALRLDHGVVRELHLTRRNLLDRLRRHGHAFVVEERLEAGADVGAVDVVREAEERVEVGETAGVNELFRQPGRLARVGQVPLVDEVSQRRPQLATETSLDAGGEHGGGDVDVFDRFEPVQHLRRFRRVEGFVVERVKFVHRVLGHLLGGRVGAPPPVLHGIPEVDHRVEWGRVRVRRPGRRFGELGRVDGVLRRFGSLPRVCHPEHLDRRTRGTFGTRREVQPAQHVEEGDGATGDVNLGEDHLAGDGHDEPAVAVGVGQSRDFHAGFYTAGGPLWVRLGARVDAPVLGIEHRDARAAAASGTHLRHGVEPTPEGRHGGGGQNRDFIVRRRRRAALAPGPFARRAAAADARGLVRAAGRDQRPHPALVVVAGVRAPHAVGPHDARVVVAGGDGYGSGRTLRDAHVEFPRGLHAPPAVLAARDLVHGDGARLRVRSVRGDDDDAAAAVGLAAGLRDPLRRAGFFFFLASSPPPSPGGAEAASFLASAPNQRAPPPTSTTITPPSSFPSPTATRAAIPSGSLVELESTAWSREAMGSASVQVTSAGSVSPGGRSAAKYRPQPRSNTAGAAKA